MPLKSRLSSSANTGGYVPPSTARKPQPTYWDLQMASFRQVGPFEAFENLVNPPIEFRREGAAGAILDRVPALAWLDAGIQYAMGKRGSDPSFNPGEHITDEWKPFREQLMETDTLEEFNWKKEEIFEEMQRMRILEQGGMKSYLALGVAGMLDPIMLAVPAARLQGIKNTINAIRAGRAAAKAGQITLAQQALEEAGKIGLGMYVKRGLATGLETLAGAAVSEGITRQALELKPLSQSVQEVLIGATLGGMIRAGATGITHFKYNKLVKELDAAVVRHIDEAPKPKVNLVDLGVPRKEPFKVTPEGLDIPKKPIESTGQVKSFESTVETGTIKVKNYDDIGYDGVPVNQLSAFIPEEGGMKRLIPEDADGNESAFAFGIPELIRKIPILRDTFPNVYMTGKLLNKNAQDIFFELIQPSINQKKQLKGQAQTQDVYSKLLRSNDKILGEQRDAFYRSYLKMIERLKGKKETDPFATPRARTAVESLSRPEGAPSFPEFLEQSITRRRRRYYGLENPDDLPEIVEMDSYMGEKIYKPFLKWGIKKNYISKRVHDDQDYIDSYVPQVPHTERVRDNRFEFEDLVTDIYAAQRGLNRQALDEKDLARITKDAKKYVDDVLNDYGGFRKVDYREEGTIRKARYLQSRDLFVPQDRPDLYRRLEPYLNNDAFMLNEHYVRTVNADRMLDQVFPDDLGLYKAINAIQDEYNELIEATPTVKEKNAIKSESDKVLEIIETQVDRIRGVHPKLYGGEGFVFRSLERIKAINNMRLLGGVQLASLNDVARLNTETTLARPLKNLAQYAAAPFEAGLKTNDLRKLLGIYEVTLNSRYNLYTDITGPMYGPVSGSAVWRGVDRLLKAGEKQVGNITWLNHWNQTVKTMAAVNAQDYLIDIAKKHARGTALSKRESLRIGEMFVNLDELSTIAEQFAKHGDTIKGSKYLNLDAWENRELANRLLDGLKKDVNQTITTINPGVVPLWAEGPIGRQLLHLRSFDLASTSMFLIRQLQFADYQAAMAFIEMITLGAMIGTLRRGLAGKDLQTDNIGFLIGDGIDRSGTMGLFGQINGIMDRSLGIGVTSLLGGDAKSLRYGERNPFLVPFGPAVGLGEDIGKGPLGATINILHGKPIDRYQVGKTFDLLPWQNLWYLQKGINTLEEGAARMVGAKESRRRRGVVRRGGRQ